MDDVALRQKHLVLLCKLGLCITTFRGLRQDDPYAPPHNAVVLDVLHSQDLCGFQLPYVAQPRPREATVEVSPPPYMTKSIRLHRLNLPAIMDRSQESIACSQTRQEQMQMYHTC